MKKLLLFTFIILFSFPFAQSYYTDLTNPEDLTNPDGYYEYKIIKGDCLWFISDDFYGDPYKWTTIHEANPYIVNPDWIYTGNWLVIPNIFADENGNPIFGTSAKTWSEEEATWSETAETWSGDEKLDSNVLIAKYGIDSDGDGIIDGVDINGDGVIDESAGIDIDGDGVVDGYDIDGDGKIDIKSGAVLSQESSDSAISEASETETAVVSTTTDATSMASKDLSRTAESSSATAATTTMASGTDMNAKDSKKHDKSEKPCDCKKTYCGKPGWKLGLHAGFPLASAPEDESLNVGVLLGTPLGVKAGPLYIGLGAGAFTYNFEDIYIGGGLLASLCINELLKLDMPLILQIHGAGYYVFGEESGPGFGVIGSGSLPIGDSPISLGAYIGLGQYYPGEKDFNWGNAGAVIYYNF